MDDIIFVTVAFRVDNNAIDREILERKCRDITREAIEKHSIENPYISYDEVIIP